ncbi:MAG: hypothetical protein C4321_04375, partial [Chloroflexota bacterium]
MERKLGLSPIGPPRPARLLTGTTKGGSAMKKLALILGVASAALVVAHPSYAQGPFADVPTDHWAYSAVTELQSKGVFTGYPDGTFGGKRALTRYEFAVAIQRAMGYLQGQIDELKNRPNSNVDLGSVNARIDALEGRVNNLQSTVDNLQRLINEFRDTLAQLGSNVDQLQRDVRAMQDRLTAVEQAIERMPKITGTATVGARGSGVQRGATTPDGSLFGTDRDQRSLGLGGRVGKSPLTNVRPVYDLDLGITARLGDVATVKTLLSIGNYVDGYLNKGLSTFRGFGNVSDSAGESVFPYYLYVEAPINLGFGGAALTVGKFGI